MDYWDFTSDNSQFSLKLPGSWSEYDDDDDLFAFFNTERWSGNLRISYLYLQNDDGSGVDGSFLYNQSELVKHPDAILVKLGKWEAVFYTKETDADGAIYFWITGSKNDLFICSLSFDKAFLGSDWHNNELIVVAEILSSIKILA